MRVESPAHPAPRPREENGWSGWDTASPIRHEGSFSTDNDFPAASRPGGGAPASPGPLTHSSTRPHTPADPPASRFPSRGLEAPDRPHQVWAEVGRRRGAQARKRPARQPFVSTPWLPATGPGTLSREGCPRRPGHCWRAAPHGSGCSPPWLHEIRGSVVHLKGSLGRRRC